MSYIAPSPTHLKRRVDDYLWGNQSVPLKRLREILKQHFMGIAPTAVIGGLIRDLARAGVDEFKSDVDLVVDAPNRNVVGMATRLKATANRFGGFSTTLGSWKVDFWALRNTWAHREGHVRISKLSDITRCTFFTADAVAYHLQERQIITRPEYLRDVRSNVLEINLRPNPSVEGNLLRATRRVLSRDMLLGDKLKEFVFDHLDDEAFEYIVQTEIRLYGHSFAQPYSNAERLTEALVYRAKRIPCKAHQRNQLLLAI